MEPDALPRRKRLERLSARALRGLGRVPFPLLRRGDAEFLQLAWDDAVKLAGRRLAAGGRLVRGDRALSVEATASAEAMDATLPDGPAVLTVGPAATDADFRAHVLELLSPEIVAAEGREVLLLPALSRYSQTDGATWLGPDDVVRFSPEIRGNPVPGARPDHHILDAIRGAVVGGIPAGGSLHPAALGGR